MKKHLNNSNKAPLTTLQATVVTGYSFRVLCKIISKAGLRN